CLARPVDEMETVFVAAVFDGAVFGKSIGLESTVFDSQRMVDNQLHGNDRVDLGGITAFVGDGITQSGQIHQRGLSQDVMTDDTCGKPWKIQVATALDELAQRIV